jgi:hypothetical protein
MAELHDRMPVILEPGDWPAWLGETEGDPASLLHPAPDGTLHLAGGSARGQPEEQWRGAASSRSRLRCEAEAGGGLAGGAQVRARRPAEDPMRVSTRSYGSAEDWLRM